MSIKPIIDQLKGKLEEYLYMINLHPARGGKNFSCPNKAGHTGGDSNPSASLFQGDDGKLAWYCHTCQAGSDIFALAHHVENLPLSGPEFITRTVKSLCDKLGVPFDLDKDISPEEKERLDIFKANEYVAKYLAEHPNRDYLSQRGIALDIAKRLCIGSGEAVAIHNHLLENGISQQTMISAGLFPSPSNDPAHPYTGRTARMMFNADTMVFPIRDADGNVTGFISRNMIWKKGDEGSKYVNTQNNAVFKKSQQLYMVDQAKKKIADTGVVILVEGPIDAITLFGNGITNIVCIQGVSFSSEHLAILKKINIKHVIFCLDGDTAGAARTIDNVEKIIRQNYDMMISVKRLPPEHDPDSLVREKGIAAFADIPAREFPDHMAEVFLAKTGNSQEENINDYMRWMLDVVKAPMARMKHIKFLAQLTGIEESQLVDQMRYFIRIEDVKAASGIDAAFEDLKYKWRTSDMDDKLTALDEARKQVTSLLWSARKNVLDENKKDMADLEQRIMTSTCDRVLTGFPRLDREIVIPKRASRVVFAAYPNIGKSNITRNLAMNIVKNNADVSVLYCSLDDPKPLTIPAFVGMVENYEINKIRYPQSLNNTSERRTCEKHIRSGFATLISLMNENRLMIADQTDVPTTSALESYIMAFRENINRKNSNQSLITIVDSLHSFMDLSKSGEIRVEVIQSISEMKRLATMYDTTIIMNAELNKEGRTSKKRPSLANISETGRIEYLVSIGAVVHSDLAPTYSGTHSMRYWSDKNYPDSKFPILELDFEKNKEGFFKGSIWYRLNPMTGTIMEMTAVEEDEIRRAEIAREART